MTEEIFFMEEDQGYSEKDKGRVNKISTDIIIICNDLDNIFVDIKSRLSSLVDCFDQSAQHMGESFDEDYMIQLFDNEDEAQYLWEEVENIIDEYGYDPIAVLECLQRMMDDYLKLNGYEGVFDPVLELLDEIMLVDKPLGLLDLEFSFPVNDNLELQEVNDLSDDIPIQLNYRNIRIDANDCKALYRACGLKEDSSKGKGGHVKFIDEESGVSIVFSGSDLYLRVVVDELIESGISIERIEFGLKKKKYIR